MPYFSDHYRDLSYPLVGAGPGLYNAQIGAIHAVASHFTVEDRPAIVTMPTGSGKTAVLMTVPFLLRSTRVLVITPSRLVRGQIREDFAALRTLREAGALPGDIALPRVCELDQRIDSREGWEALREYEVVVSTPNCTSPEYGPVPQPPGDLFDLLLIDEAHHSPAATWKGLLDAFHLSRRVLFTATPFRRDRGEIDGRFVYSYPIARAYRDGIFGQIAYVQVAPAANESNDIAVARKAAEVFAADRASGLNHFVMVRTDGKKRAEELANLYARNTPLRLRLVHSGLANRTVKDVLAKLESAELDGIICVNMMGEGFNFPRLKIAAIHAPHRSLEVTLQFVGRFARTNAPDIGEAKFIAVLSEIDIEGKRLFEEGKIWQEIIPDLSHGRIAGELRVREELQRFHPPDEAESDLANLSLYSLYPRSHVKIYDVEHDIDLRATSVTLKPGIEVRYSSVNDTGTVAVLIARVRERPKWSSGKDIVDTSHDLFIVFYDPATKLLFINSSRSVEGIYRTIVEALSDDAKLLATGDVGKVIKGVDNRRVFNVGMRNILATTTVDSYKILAGSDTQAGITAADSRKYRQGHVFLSGEEGGERTTIGYSSGSKVWSAASNQIPELLDWCKSLGHKIRSTGPVITNSGLDFLAPGRVVDKIPDNILWGQWNKDAFELNPPVQVEYARDDGTIYRGHILDLELEIDTNGTNANGIAFTASGDGLTLPIEFTLDNFYTTADDAERVRVIRGSANDSLIEYMNESQLSFYTADGALLTGNELFEPREPSPPIDLGQIEAVGWTGTDIESEVVGTALGRSVQEEVQRTLEAGAADIILFDHGSGEMADFITLSEAGGALAVAFYHCKGSGGPKPGARVDDVYEVCGQAQKSVAIANLSRLAKRVQQRRGKTRYVRGTPDELQALLQRARNLRQSFEIVVVQPGISKGSLSAGMLEALGATNTHLVGSGASPLRIVASA